MNTFLESFATTPLGCSGSLKEKKESQPKITLLFLTVPVVVHSVVVVVENALLQLAAALCFRAAHSCSAGMQQLWQHYHSTLVLVARLSATHQCHYYSSLARLRYWACFLVRTAFVRKLLSENNLVQNHDLCDNKKWLGL